VVRKIINWVYKQNVERATRNGMKIGEGSRIEGMPFFGSEPYLISIGNHVLISGKVTFLTHDGGTWVFREKEPYGKVKKFGRIDIFDNCFIGHGSIIMPGVQIGPNAVVAAGAIVTKDVPPGTVVAGVPARVLMTTEEYANKCLANDVPLSEENIRRDKRGELLKHYPVPQMQGRGPVPEGTAREENIALR
jgi:acetyltransferase-like isoleucine patch superfamily enzyme